MSFNAAALRLMAEKGLSASDIAEIAEAAENGRSAGAARQARYRARKKGGDVTSDVTRYRYPAPNEIDNLTPTREVKTEAKASSKSLVEAEKLQAIVTCLRKAFPAPEGVTDEQWAAFREQRKKKLNDRSYALLNKKLLKLAEDGWPPGDMIDLAIERGWETVFEPRTFGNERSDRDPTTVAVERLLGTHARTG